MHRITIGSMLTLSDKRGNPTEMLLCSLPRGRSRADDVIYATMTGRVYSRQLV